MENIIEIQNASYAYPDSKQNAVDGVTLRVRSGEFLAILGRNGSGKSTLAKLMNALFLPAEGAVRVDGIDTREEGRLLDIRRACGMVFQNPDNQMVATIVEEDVAFGPENLGVAPDEIAARVDESLRSVGMQDYAKTAPHMLSGGQKQRVAIAGVVAMRPKVLVFDEATAMLDPAGRNDVLRLIRQLNGEGITVVLITHFMEEAAQADRVAVMENGRIALEGAPAAVFSHAREIREMGLDVPEMTDLAGRLSAAGVPVPGDILTIPEMVEALCQLKSGD